MVSMSPRVNWSELWAHTRNRRGEVDPLLRHLQRVSDTAAEFASPFGGGLVAALVGILHDAGKIRPDFQQYLRRIEAGERIAHGPPHAIWGAVIAYLILRRAGGWEQVALPVFGHHAGLHAAADASLRFKEFADENQQDLIDLQQSLLETGLLRGDMGGTKISGTSLEMFIRMVFSALADADYLATEKHFDDQKGNARGGWRSIEELLQGFRQKQTAFMYDPSMREGELNKIRREDGRRALHGRVD